MKRRTARRAVSIDLAGPALAVAIVAVAASIGPISPSEASDGPPAIPGPAGASALVRTATLGPGSDARTLGFGWSAIPMDASPERDAGTSSAAHPDTIYELTEEPLESVQWYLRNVGQDGGTPGADLDIATARDLQPSTAGTVVAIIDSGIDLTHPDLIAQAWVNDGEVPGNDIDDDGNGYVDDVHGWDFIDDDADPSDVYGHGTAVASVVAAGLNGVGIAGVDPGAIVMPLRVCFSGSCPLSAIIEALAYAVDEGATIANLSLGSRSFDVPLDEAIEAATEAGLLITAAAGNDGTDNDAFAFYPASLPHDGIVAVAATDRNDDLATFASGKSNTGATTVDLAAPGASILTARVGGTWEERSGTSYAAPMVAGALALVQRMRPEASPSEVRSIVLESVDVRAGLVARVATGGRLDVGAAMIRAASTDFVDTASTIFAEDILWLSAYGITRGCNPPDNDRYCPDDTITRGQIAAMLRRALDIPPAPPTDDPFTDDDASIFEPDISAIAAAGITRGCNPPDNDRYCPDDTITRGQIAAMLRRALD